MEPLDIYKDLLHSEMAMQSFLNNEMLKMHNPDARQTFSRIRDDDTIHVILLQQIIETMEGVKEPVQLTPPKD